MLGLPTFLTHVGLVRRLLEGELLLRTRQDEADHRVWEKDATAPFKGRWVKDAEPFTFFDGTARHGRTHSLSGRPARSRQHREQLSGERHIAGVERGLGVQCPLPGLKLWKLCAKEGT
jgi:hypothetical protein